MNEITHHDFGLLRREVKDARAIAANTQHLVRRLVGPSTVERCLTVRSALCHVLARQRRRDAQDVARELFATDRSLERMMVLRAAVNPAHTGTATWATELTATVTADIADRLIPESVFVRLSRLGHQYMLDGSAVLRTPTWSPTATGMFVSEGQAIPVSAFVFSSISLTARKAANIVAIDDEMLLGSPLDVEAALHTILSESIGLMIDSVLLGSAASSAAQPPGLLNGVTPLTATVGGGLTALLGDLKQLTAAIAPALRPTFITGPLQSASLAVLVPNAAITVLTVPTMAAGTVIAVDAAAFVSALGLPSFRSSMNATLHAENTLPQPIVGGTAQPPLLASVAAPVRSSFQSDTTALRTIIPCDWVLRRTGAVAVVNSVTW